MKHRTLGILLAAGLVAGTVRAEQGAGSSALVRQLNDAFAGVYEKVAPAVVVIEVERSPEAAVPGLPEGLEFFFRSQDGGRVPLPPQEGSGVIISKEGYILTNNHVVSGAADGGITVTLKDGRKFVGQVVGADETGDIAVVKIKADGLPSAELGDSDQVKVGNFAFAIGAPEALPYTFTVGTISAVGRLNLTRNENYEEYIQTDAFIHPGSSGGPLCDIDGRVIGINTMVNGINRGLGFAIPINLARNMGQQLIVNGRVSRPYLGVKIKGLEEMTGGERSRYTGIERGVLIDAIGSGTPADASQLQPGDVVTKVDGIAVAFGHEMQKQILGKRVGQTVQLEVWRGGQFLQIPVQTAELPGNMVRASRRTPRNADQQAAPEQKGSPLGLGIKDKPEGVPPSQGVEISGVEPNSAAAVAGIQPGDIITEAAGQPLFGKADLDKILDGMDSERGVLLLIDRNGDRTFAILKP